MAAVFRRRPLLLAMVAILAIAAALGMVSRPHTADAHPLGNFTINRYSRIELYSDAVRVHYVLDMAEIPAYQEIGAIDTDGDGNLSALENAVYLESRLPALLANITLALDGEPATLSPIASDVAYPEGQAGLETLRVSAVFQAGLAKPVAALEYHDSNFSDRIGWKEIVVSPAAGVALSESSVPTQDVTQALTVYPSDLLSSPLDVTSASVTFDATAGAPAPVTADLVEAPESAVSRAGGGFAGLVDARNLTLTVVLLALAAAFGFGALHALEPGHGKTLVAAYFVGSKGSAQQALGLGAVIASTHTAGVLIIGAVTLFLSQYILPEHLYPWLSLASGLMVLFLGIRLFITRTRTLELGGKLTSLLTSRSRQPRLAPAGTPLQAKAGGPSQPSPPDPLTPRPSKDERETTPRISTTPARAPDHHHGPGGHDHPHGHPHTHDVVPGSPWRTLFALGLADGLTPSPSALIVLLAAVSLDRIGLGVALIAAFSIGLASVLTGVCIALVYAQRFLAWLSSRRDSVSSTPVLGWAAAAASPEGPLMRIVPVGGAVALVAVGSVLTLRALSAPMLSLL